MLTCKHRRCKELCNIDEPCLYVVAAKRAIYYRMFTLFCTAFCPIFPLTSERSENQGAWQKRAENGRHKKHHSYPKLHTTNSLPMLNQIYIPKQSISSSTIEYMHGDWESFLVRIQHRPTYIISLRGKSPSINESWVSIDYHRHGAKIFSRIKRYITVNGTGRGRQENGNH